MIHIKFDKVRRLKAEGAGWGNNERFRCKTVCHENGWRQACQASQNLQNQEDGTGFLFLIPNHQTNGIQKGFPGERKRQITNLIFFNIVDIFHNKVIIK